MRQILIEMRICSTTSDGNERSTVIVPDWPSTAVRQFDVPVCGNFVLFCVKERFMGFGIDKVVVEVGFKMIYSAPRVSTESVSSGNGQSYRSEHSNNCSVNSDFSDLTNPCTAQQIRNRKISVLDLHTGDCAAILCFY